MTIYLNTSQTLADIDYFDFVNKFTKKVDEIDGFGVLTFFAVFHKKLR